MTWTAVRDTSMCFRTEWYSAAVKAYQNALPTSNVFLRIANSSEGGPENEGNITREGDSKGNISSTFSIDDMTLGNAHK